MAFLDQNIPNYCMLRYFETIRIIILVVEKNIIVNFQALIPNILLDQIFQFCE